LPGAPPPLLPAAASRSRSRSPVRDEALWAKDDAEENNVSSSGTARVSELPSERSALLESVLRPAVARYRATRDAPDDAHAKATRALAECKARVKEQELLLSLVGTAA
jgi:hypothetical protein